MMSSSCAKLGKLTAQLVLPEESQQLHYGSEDAITGEVVVTYRAANGLLNKITGKTAETSDLFGPLKLEITLHGRLKLKVQGDGSTSDRGSPVISKAFIVHQGSFRAEVGHDYNFPFSICFPSATTTIPPSFRMKFMARACTVKVVIEYWLSVQLLIPGIEVKTEFQQVGDKPWVKYELPHPQPSIAENNASNFQHRVKIQNAYVLPEEQRPQGFRQKARAAISSRHFPKLLFDVCCSELQNVFPDKPLKFKIAICPIEGSDAYPFPETTLEGFQVQLVASTSVEPGQKSTTKRPWIDSRTVQQLGSRRSLPTILLPGIENSLDLTTEPITMLPSSFRYGPLSRQYQLVVTLQVMIANRKIRVHRKCPVIVLPAPHEQSTRASHATSALRQSLALTHVGFLDEEAPSYISSEIEENRSAYSSSSGELPALATTSKLHLNSG